MKKNRHSEERIVGILREAQGGGGAQHNISAQTLDNWKRKRGAMEVSDVRQMKARAEENGRLKRIVADLVAQVDILKFVNAKKW
jgi:putative transposase